MKTNKLFLIITLNFLVLSLNAQYKIFFAASGDLQDAFIKENNLNNISIFYQSSFVDTNGKEFDQSKFEKTLDSRIPNINASGYAVLDWEGKGLEILTKGKGHIEFLKVREQFIKALQFAKKTRPNIKWSYYGIPTRNYWSTNQRWVNINLELIEIIKLQDFISPSLYVLYLKGEQNVNLDLNYIKSNVSLALRLGKELNKPVYPFVFHRNRTRKKEHMDSLVDKDWWDFYLKNITETSYSGKKISGVIWWNSERFTASNKNKSNAVLREFIGVKDLNEHQKNIFNTYLRGLRKYQK